MKTLIASSLILFSATTFANTITVDGLQAKAILDIASELNSTDGAMGGRLFAELENIECEKTVDDVNDVYLQKCSFDAFEHVEVRSDSEVHRFTAEAFRVALNDTAKNEIKVSDIKKTISVKKISCKAIGLGHALDAIDIEPKYSCTITF